MVHYGVDNKENCQSTSGRRREANLQVSIRPDLLCFHPCRHFLCAEATAMLVLVMHAERDDIVHRHFSDIRSHEVHQRGRDFGSLYCIKKQLIIKLKTAPKNCTQH